jgi:hypothetical protein
MSQASCSGWREVWPWQVGPEVLKAISMPAPPGFACMQSAQNTGNTPVTPSLQGAESLSLSSCTHNP